MPFPVATYPETFPIRERLRVNMPAESSKLDQYLQRDRSAPYRAALSQFVDDVGQFVIAKNERTAVALNASAHILIGSLKSLKNLKIVGADERLVLSETLRTARRDLNSVGDCEKNSRHLLSQTFSILSQLSEMAIMLKVRRLSR